MKPILPQNQTGLPDDVTTSFLRPSQSSGYSKSGPPMSRPHSQAQVQNLDSYRFTSSTFTSDNNPRLMLGASSRRKYLLLQNNSISTIYVGFGTVPGTLGVNALVLPPNGGITFENGIVPNNDVYVVSALPSSVTVIEGLIL